MKKFLVAFLFISFYSFAQVSLQTCSDEAKLYAKAEQLEGMPAGCDSLVKSSPQSKILLPEIELYAKSNMIYFDRYTIDQNGTRTLISSNLLAGDQTRFGNVIDLDVSLSDMRFFVLSSDGDDLSVFSYTTEYGGNLAPKKKLITSELQGTNKISVDSNDSKIYAISSANGWVKSFHLNADPDGFLSENSVERVRIIDAAINSPVDVASSSSEVFILEQDKILVFGKTEDDPSPQYVIDGAGVFVNVISVSFDESENALKVKNSEGDIVTFVKDEVGGFLRVD